MSKINKVKCQMSKINKVNFDGAYLRSSSGHFFLCICICLRLFSVFDPPLEAGYEEMTRGLNEFLSKRLAKNRRKTLLFLLFTILIEDSSINPNHTCWDDLSKHRTQGSPRATQSLFDKKV